MIAMGHDYIVDVFYGFFVDEKDAADLEGKYGNEGEEDGWFMLSEKLEREKNPVQACIVAEGVEKGDVKDYHLAIASRASFKRMYINMDNEILKIADLTIMNDGWDEMLRQFCSEHGITFAVPEWWLSTEG